MKTVFLLALLMVAIVTWPAAAQAQPATLLLFGKFNGRIPSDAPGQPLQVFPNMGICLREATRPENQEKLHHQAFLMSWGAVDQPGYGWAVRCRPATQKEYAGQILMQHMFPSSAK